MWTNHFNWCRPVPFTYCQIEKMVNVSGGMLFEHNAPSWVIDGRPITGVPSWTTDDCASELTGIEGRSTEVLLFMIWAVAPVFGLDLKPRLINTVSCWSHFSWQNDAFVWRLLPLKSPLKSNRVLWSTWLGLYKEGALDMGVRHIFQLLLLARKHSEFFHSLRRTVLKIQKQPAQ